MSSTNCDATNWTDIHNFTVIVSWFSKTKRRFGSKLRFISQFILTLSHILSFYFSLTHSLFSRSHSALLFVCFFFRNFLLHFYYSKNSFSWFHFPIRCRPFSMLTNAIKTHNFRKKMYKIFHLFIFIFISTFNTPFKFYACQISTYLP